MREQNPSPQIEISERAIAKFISKNKKLFKELNVKKFPKYKAVKSKRNHIKSESFQDNKLGHVKSLRSNPKNYGLEYEDGTHKVDEMKKKVLQEYEIVPRNGPKVGNIKNLNSSRKNKLRKLRPKNNLNRFTNSKINKKAAEGLFKKKARDSKSLEERMVKIKKFDYLLNSRFGKKKTSIVSNAKSRTRLRTNLEEIQSQNNTLLLGSRKHINLKKSKNDFAKKEM